MIQVFLHLALTTELWAFVRQLTEGAFAVRQLTDKVNEGTIPIAIGMRECTACPDESGSANNEHNVC